MGDHGMSEAVCASIASLYSNSKQLRVLFALETGLSLLAILCLFLLLFLLVAWKMFTSNVRIILFGFCLSLLLTNVSIMISSIYHLHAIIIRPKNSHCYWLSFTYHDCYLLKNLTNVCLFLIYSSTASFSLERIINAITSPPKKVKNMIALLVVSLQFVAPLIVILRSASDPGLVTSHCISMFPNMIELKQFYFVVVSMIIFALATYTVLLFHTCSFAVQTQLKRVNYQLYETIKDTEVTFPLVVMLVFFFLTNLFLDRTFLLTLQSYFPSHPWIHPNSGIAAAAFWNELQALTCPLFSLIFFGLVVRNAWDIDADHLYDKTLSECAQSLKTYYETMLPKSPDMRACRRTKSSEDVYKCVEKPGHAAQLSPEQDFRSKTLPNYGSKNNLNRVSSEEAKV